MFIEYYNIIYNNNKNKFSYSEGTFLNIETFGSNLIKF